MIPSPLHCRWSSVRQNTSPHGTIRSKILSVCFLHCSIFLWTHLVFRKSCAPQWRNIVRWVSSVFFEPELCVLQILRLRRQITDQSPGIRRPIFRLKSVMPIVNLMFFLSICMWSASFSRDPFCFLIFVTEFFVVEICQQRFIVLMTKVTIVKSSRHDNRQDWPVST